MVKEKLTALGLTLPPLSKPGGNYVSVNIRGNIAYIAIQFPKDGDLFPFKGKLGKELNTDDGYKAMQLCALNVIAHIEKSIGIANIEGLNHVDAYYQAADQWDEAPKVVDGASDLFVNVLGDKGIHSRSIFGVERLARNFPVGIACTVTIKS
jgi:enamine deaminase RidA (YjgF/YER057c/UK114 family)